MRKNVTFKSSDDTIAGHLYVPDDASPSKRYPAIVVGGPLATVKEQAAGVFAKALAAKGFITLAFDYRRYGESGGTPRQYEDPASKTEDVQNALSFLSAQENVDSERIGALGVCASSSYISSALRSDRRVKAFGTVSAHFSLREFFGANPFTTDEQKQSMYAKSNAARQRYYESGEAEPDDMIMPDMEEPPADAHVLIAEVYDYYFRRVADEWPNYSNHMVPFSFEQLVRSHAIDYASEITCPYLGVVGAVAATRSFTERFIEAKTQGSATIEVIDGGTHIRTYDNPEYVGQGVDALSGFFQAHLG
jgi:fermentation-respiration switch protein FrsA (DUF1100 family)